MADSTKKWWQSLGVWGGVIATISAIFTAAIGAIDAQFGTHLAAAGWVTMVTSALGGIVAIIGRLRAATTIK